MHLDPVDKSCERILPGVELEMDWRLNSETYTFERLLDYELSQSVRHRRYMSVVMFCLKDSCRELTELLREDVRQSDEMFFYKDHFVVLMGTTSKSEAIEAVNRYGVDLDGYLDMRCSISSFPDDGKTSSELLNILKQRLKKAMTLDHGSFVSQ